MNKFILSVLLVGGYYITPLYSLDLFEDFKSPGKPKSSNKVEWSFRCEMLPVKDWKEIVPGDGFAYLEIDSKSSNDKSSKNGKRAKWPFQMIKFSSVGPWHRLEMKARNTVIPGVASFIFTYNQKGNIFDEIDIEIVGDDANTKPNPHKTDKSGWTDVRFNTWANANAKKCKPEISHKKAIVDKRGKKVSHQDGKFHIYTIEWRKDRIDFFIDGVHQQTITELVPDKATTVLVGMRHMSWTGKFDWKGSRKMIVDWIRVEPIKNEATSAGK
jgi:hypothetical protein